MVTEDHMADTYRILGNLKDAAANSDFATYCEMHELCENLGISTGSISKAYKMGVAEAKLEKPFFRQNCSIKIESEYTPSKSHGTPNMREFTVILNSLAEAAYGGDARAYRQMVARAKFAGANNDQLRDSYEYGRRKLGATWFGWDGTRLAR